VFFAGGQDNSGPTSSVEMWLPAPDIKRRGEPEFSMSFAGRDRGGLVCGGHLVLAGGHGSVKAAEQEEAEESLCIGCDVGKHPKPHPKPTKSELQSFVVSTSTALHPPLSPELHLCQDLQGYGTLAQCH
jgi:hypothetical protein